MSHELMKVFQFDGEQIRIEVDDQGDPWFCLRDVCAVLGINNGGNVAADIDEEDKKIVVVQDGTRGNPNMIFVSEAGLWAAVMRSRKPVAKEFKRWLAKEVIPSIRKNGGYLTDATKMNPIKLMRSMSQQERVAMLAATFEADLEDEQAKTEEERRRRIEADEGRRAAEARASSALDDNAKIMSEHRQLERKFEVARNEVDSLAKHSYRVKKTIDELFEALDSGSPDILARHDVEGRVEHPPAPPPAPRQSRNAQWIDNIYAPPPKSDGEEGQA